MVSLSARRAWIEIVDPDKDTLTDESLSARRAWIEILCAAILSALVCVALRKESVDRNADGVVSGSADYGRSPQGERG